MTHKVDGVIFDLDGTLLDTEGTNKQAVASLMADYGKEFTDELHKKVIGAPAVDGAAYLIEALDLPKDKLNAKELALEWERRAEKLGHTVTVLPGALEILDRLQKKNVPMALATSATTTAVTMKRGYHPEIFDHFPVIVTGDDPLVKKGKPNPDIFLAAARRLFNDENAPTTKSILVIEDSVQGVSAGKAAGMITIAVPDSTLYTAEEREEIYSHADEIASSLNDIDETKYGL